MSESKFKVSASPHIRDWRSTTDIMLDVIIALLPAAAVGVFNFGLNAFLLILVCIVSCMLSEYFSEKAFKKKNTVRDLSAALTGLLLALNLPPELPLWMAMVGSVFAIVVVKQMFGGIGQNFMNPALAGRCFLMISFVGRMTSFTYDGVTTATPLYNLKTGAETDLLSMFIGNEAGTIGETSALALLAGAIYLLARKVISFRIPVFYIATFAILVGIYAFTGLNLDACNAGVFVLKEICGGGLMLGAFFMATDYVTSPITDAGKVVYGILLGLLTFVLRIYGSSAEGVSYAIIISNLLVPLIEMVTKPKAFGAGFENKPLSENMGRDKGEKKDKETIGKVVFAICLIGIIAGCLLGAVYNITKEPIANTKEKNKLASYKEVLKDANDFPAETASAEDIAKVVAESGISGTVINEVVSGKDASGNVVGYVVVVTTHDGYAGDIQMAVGLDTKGVVTGISMLTINETAGLGKNAKDDPSFAAQYVGKDVDQFAVTKNEPAADTEIKAISGATITSKAVTNAVNTAKYYIKNMAGGGANE